jgi:putative tryptophan/tyrosine transport system substrate-binding protein
VLGAENLMKRRQFIFLLGGAATWPLSVQAQPIPKVARIGLLVGGGPLETPEMRAGFDVVRQGFAELGYIEGQSVIFEQRADYATDRLSVLAAELVRLKVDVIIALGSSAGHAAQRATATIPIVIGSMGDPAEEGFVASLARPGGNITGTTFLGPELVPKRFALLKELLPAMSRVVGVWQPDAFGERTSSEMRKETAEAATALGVQLQLVEVRKPDEFERAFSDISQSHADALIEFPSPMFFGARQRIVDLAAIHRLPAMYNAREFVQIGGLIAYGANIADLSRRTASFADKILKGAKPSDLPVERPTKFELAINHKTAETLGLAVPPTLLAQADGVIE